MTTTRTTLAQVVRQAWPEVFARLDQTGSQFDTGRPSQLVTNLGVADNGVPDLDHLAVLGPLDELQVAADVLRDLPRYLGDRVLPVADGKEICMR